METILYVAHVEADGQLSKHALEALSAAHTLQENIKGSTLQVGLIGKNVQDAANSIASCGADKFLAVTGDEFAVSRYATDAAAAEMIAKTAKPTIIVAPGTLRMNKAMPGVAQRLGGKVDTHLVGLTVDGGALAVNRWYYRQRMEAVQKRTHRPWVLLMDGGCAPAYQTANGTATVQNVIVDVGQSMKRTTVVGVQSPKSDQQTIRPDAEMLLVAGAGWTKKQKDGQTHTDQAATLILGFITRTQASLGSSKSLVDMGGEGQAVLPFLTHLHQIGQTGSTPRHAKGLATCCHGEEPHVVGWRFIKDRRAINMDANCGWARGKADVVYVADAFAVMEKVNALLGNK